MLLSASSAQAARPARLSRQVQRRLNAVRVSATATEAPAEAETYQVILEKPLQIKFARGNDAGSYVISKANVPEYDMFEIGDKILEVSASFGDDIWPASNYGQVMYAMKTRIGNVYLRMEKRYGDLSALEKQENTAFMKERNGGNYGAGTAEVQRKNYVNSKELEAARAELFEDGLRQYKEKKFDDAIITFENVVGLEPKKYIGDNMEKVTPIYRLAQYNIACCYSQINQLDAGLDALKTSMLAGFEDYKMIRSDNSLAFLRTSDQFEKLLNKFDEPLIDERTVKAFKKLFGFGNN